MKTKRRTKGKDFRSPLAKARDAFLESHQGIACLETSILRDPMDGRYLRNRIEMAFLAGAEALKGKRK